MANSFEVRFPLIDHKIVEFMTKFTLPIVVLTGTGDINIEEKFRNKNILDYVIKDGIAALSYTFSIVKRILHNNKIKVLVVDDSKTFVEQTKRLLQKYRYERSNGINQWIRIIKRRTINVFEKTRTARV